MGYDIPARKRNADDEIVWSDEARMIGYYISTLAMEYDLLVKSGFASNSPEVMQTKKELFFAIEAINRLDWEAEQSWNCSECIGSGYCPENINGFMIRDDVPDYFAINQMYIDKLNESWMPIHFGHRIKCIKSSYVGYINPGSEMSQDHLAFLFMGFAFVKRYIPENENYNNQIFSDGKNSTCSFVKEVQEISTRIINYLAENDWVYWNTCEERCVHGVNNEKNENVCYNNPNNPSTGSLCDKGGANAFFNAIGFAASGIYINEGGIYEQHIQNILNSVFSFSSNVYWNNSVSNSQSYPKILAAIGAIGHVNVWNHNPESKSDLMTRLCNAAINEHWEYLPLMYNLLHSQQLNIPIPQTYYECLLDAAPCTGYDGEVESAEWCHGDRIGGDRMNPENNVSLSPLYYMFYFNLIHEAFYYSSYDFSPIPINELAPENLHLELLEEYDKKNYMASNEIVANDYHIKNSSTEGQGRVQFVSGNKIVLGDNFRVEEGAVFHASIDPSITTRYCTETSYTDCHHILDEARSHEDLVEFRRKDSIYLAQMNYTNFEEQEFLPQYFEISFEVIPIPSDGIIEINTNLKGYTFSVLSVTGETVYSNYFNDSNIELDLTFLSAGLYICTIKNEQGTKSLKLIIN